MANKINTPLASSFQPAAVEKDWSAFWLAHHSNSRKPTNKGDKTPRESFSMLLPPPNVTGVLHIGHALTLTIQDALARWHSMHGKAVTWLPSLDHAGIATQSVVEKQLVKTHVLSKSRHEIGRDAFLDYVWDWTRTHGGLIRDQFARCGAHLDWSADAFSMDPPRSHAVTEAFVRLHEQGLVYRHSRIVNWCPFLQTAISDIEVDALSVEKKTFVSVPGRKQPVAVGLMHRFKYMLADGSGDYLEVDTTRPETIWGDVALAVHPDDPRYLKYHHAKVFHPLTSQRLPIVTDAMLVKLDLGTGVVKITPAHDANDYACALRHELDHSRIIMTPEATLDLSSFVEASDAAAFFHGLDRFDARDKMISTLTTKGLYLGANDHPTTVSVCSRSGDIVEPRLMPQWYIATKDMAALATDAVVTGKTSIQPPEQKTVYFRWLDNVTDWCVSRQLWWGHRIPAYEVLAREDNTFQEDHFTATPPSTSQPPIWLVARTREEAVEMASTRHGLTVGKDCDLRQDDDVLDTWFSASLFPLSMQGWPHTSSDPHKLWTAAKASHYPLSVMETGHDILFFWVARMAMVCTTLVGVEPFSKVLLHPLVRDSAGRKMSKSLGNVINPIDVIQGISSDAMQQALHTGNLPKQEIQRMTKELKREFPDGIPECGADALRFTLASYMQQGRQINLDLSRTVSSRHFCNKIWQATSFVLRYCPEKDNAADMDAVSSPLSFHDWQINLRAEKSTMRLHERWILSRLARTVTDAHHGFTDFSLGTTTRALHRFFHNDFCDVYLESSKAVVSVPPGHSSGATLVTLHTVLDLSLRLLHPLMPFITEELWQRVRRCAPANNGSSSSKVCPLMYVPLPTSEALEEWLDPEAEESYQLVLESIHALRTLRPIHQLLRDPVMTLASNHDDTSIVTLCLAPSEASGPLGQVLQTYVEHIQSQCRLGALRVIISKELPQDTMAFSVLESCQVCLPLPQSTQNVDHVSMKLAAELARLDTKISRLTATLTQMTTRLQSEAFLQSAPASVIDTTRGKADQLTIERSGVQINHDRLASLLDRIKQQPLENSPHGA